MTFYSVFGKTINLLFFFNFNTIVFYFDDQNNAYLYKLIFCHFRKLLFFYGCCHILTFYFIRTK